MCWLGLLWLVSAIRALTSAPLSARPVCPHTLQQCRLRRDMLQNDLIALRSQGCLREQRPETSR